MKAVNRVQRAAADEPFTELFYADAADVEPNPRIGSDWMPRGQRRAAATPGKNRKRYLAGALHA